MLFEALLACTVFLVGLSWWNRDRYDLNKIPSPRALPFVGHGVEVIRAISRGENQFAIRDRWLQQTGNPKVMRVESFGSTTLYIRDAECIKTVVLGMTNPLPRPQTLTDYLLPVLGNDATSKSTILNEHVSPYTKAVRAAYAVALQRDRLEKTMPRIHTVMMRLIDLIEQQRKEGPVDLQDLCVRLTMDTIGTVAWDMNFGALDGSTQMYNMFQTSFDVGLQTRISPSNLIYTRMFPESETAQSQKNAIEGMAAEWSRLLNVAKERNDKGPPGEEPLWYLLKQTIDPETGAPLRDKDLVTELSTMMVAGMPTTGHQLTWIIAFLFTNRGVLEKLLNELHEYGLFESQGKDVSVKVLEEMPYLNASIKEGMRLGHVILESTARIATEDMTVMGYRIPKGTRLIAPGNRWVDPGEDWSDPEVFRPERWLTEEDMSHKHFFPFSHGARDCAGQNLARLEMRLAMVYLLTRFEFKFKKPLEELMQHTKTRLSTQSVGGIFVDVVPKTPSA